MDPQIKLQFRLKFGLQIRLQLRLQIGRPIGLQIMPQIRQCTGLQFMLQIKLQIELRIKLGGVARFRRGAGAVSARRRGLGGRRSGVEAPAW